MSRFNSKKVGKCFGLVMGQLCPSKGTPGQYDITTETKAKRSWQLSVFGTTRTRDIFLAQVAATLERLQSMENMLCTDHLHHLCTTSLNLRGCTQLLQSFSFQHFESGDVQNLPSKK
jgi:hypothetical protein